MRFLDNVLQDFIDRAPDEMARAKSTRRARALGRPRRDGLPLASCRRRACRSRARWPSRGTCGCSSTSARQADEASMMLAQERGPCPDAADMGVMERFSCKMAIAPTASISIICGGTSAGIEPIPANIYTHKTLSGTFSVKNPYLEKLLDEKAQEHRPRCGTRSSSTAARSSTSTSSRPDEKDVYKTAFEIDQRWLIELAADRTPVHRPGAVAQPVHPGRRRQVGPAHAALPRLGAGHQVALLPALQVGAARRLRRRGRGRQHRPSCAKSRSADHRLRGMPGLPVDRSRGHRRKPCAAG